MKRPTWPEILFRFKTNLPGMYADQKKALLTGVGEEVD